MSNISYYRYGQTFNALISSLICAMLLAACTPKPESVSIAIHNWPGYEPLPLAREMGWLDAKQVKINQTTSLSDSIKLFEEGKVDAAGITMDAVLHLRDKGIPVSVILICDISAGADMLLARPNIKNLSNLKRHPIAVEEGALGELMLYHVLQKANLKQDEVKTVYLSVDKQAEAWQHRKIDAAISYEPAVSEILRLGGKNLFDSSQMPNMILDVIAVRTTVLDKAHDEAIHHLVAAHLKGLTYISTNPDDAAYRMAPRFNLPHDQVMATFKGLVLPDLDNNIRLFKSSPPTVLKSTETLAAVMLKAGILQQPADLDGLFRSEYLPFKE
jgi:NitT/TauT family transport system substrate-binding protein